MQSTENVDSDEKSKSLLVGSQEHSCVLGVKALVPGLGDQ